jgi:predicted metal-binding membrane protein
MHVAVYGHPSDWRSGASAWLARHPESSAWLAVAAAWLVLLTHAPATTHGGAHAGGRGNLPADVALALPQWLTMTVAMMGPAALMALRHTAANSLVWRRGRAMLEFSAAYVATWMLFGIAALAVAERLSMSRWTAMAVTLAAAAVWQLSPAKRRALRACHRSVPLPPRGWRAELGAVRFGLRHGLACVGSCWCVMLAMAMEPGGHVLWMLPLTGALTAERLLERPLRATRVAAAALTVGAVLSAGAAAVTP